MLGRHLPPPTDLVIALKDLPPPPAHPFYQRLNTLLDEAGFEPFVEDLCRPYYAEGFGRPGVPPGVYFRMLFFGYFEGLSSQRAIAWRCADPTRRGLSCLRGCRRPRWVCASSHLGLRYGTRVPPYDGTLRRAPG